MLLVPFPKSAFLVSQEQQYEIPPGHSYSLISRVVVQGMGAGGWG